MLLFKLYHLNKFTCYFDIFLHSKLSRVDMVDNEDLAITHTFLQRMRRSIKPSKRKSLNSGKKQQKIMANESKPFQQVCTLQWDYIFIVDKRRLQKSQNNCFFEQMVSKTHCQSFTALDQFILSALLVIPSMFLQFHRIFKSPL